MINSIEENELMKSFYNLIPYFGHFLNEDVGFSITNRERYLLVQNGEKVKISSKTGDLFPEGCAADVCMKQGKKINIIVPKKVFGTAIKTTAVPVFVDNKIEGAIVIAMCMDKFEKMSDLSSALSAALEQISASTSDIAAKFKEVSQSSNNIEKFISKTSEQTQKTNEVLGFVESIAKQTNLLGLNAAIESARAGDYGKGFSVVSNEIRKLSQSTKESVDTISTILNNIRSSVDSIEKNFLLSNELISQQAISLQEIDGAIQSINTSAIILNDYAANLNT